MKRIAALLSAAALTVSVLFLAACGAPYDRTTFVLSKDGSAKQYIIDDAYSDTGIGELKTYVENSVKEYQGDSEETRVRIDKCDIADGKVDIELFYASCADYAAYNDVICFDGTLEEASAAGFDLDRGYTNAEGSGISYSQLSSYETDKQVRVLIMNEVTAVELPGTVLAYSTNVSTDGNGRLITLPDTDESIPEEFRTINYENAYFVYEL